jgi:hypothetical protein
MKNVGQNPQEEERIQLPSATESNPVLLAG